LPAHNETGPEPAAAARMGVDAELLRSVRLRIEDAVELRAAGLFRPGGGPGDLGRPELRAAERVLHYYDYQASCLSVLARVAAGQGARGERARALVDLVLANAREYVDARLGRGGQGSTAAPAPLRRLLLHLARGYGSLRGRMSERERGGWLRTAERAAEDIIGHCRRFHPGLSELHNATVGTGVNHLAICAEGVFFAGRAFERPGWCDVAGDFIERLVAFCHPDGYFEENTNARREGGPSLDYNSLSLGAAYHVCRAGGTLDRHAGLFRRSAELNRNFCDARLDSLAFADERTNRLRQRTFGLAAHSLSAEGRGYLRLLLAAGAGGTGVPLREMPLQMLARADHELGGMETGPGAAPEPWREGDTRLTLPLALRRRGEWTCGVSALKALNREIAPAGDYALDRQNLLCLVHRRAGRVLAAFKSKRDADWSTLRRGDDAFPVETGELTITREELAASVVFRSFSAGLAWRLGERAELLLRSDHGGEILAQLPLEAGVGDRVLVSGGREILLGDEAIEVGGVRSVSCGGWSAEADREGILRWPLGPHEPYNEGSRAAPDAWRALWVLPWEGSCWVSFGEA